MTNKPLDTEEEEEPTVQEEWRRDHPRGPIPDLNRRAEMTKLRDLGYTYDDIGERFGLSRQRVHQILNPNRYRYYRSH